MSDGFVSSFSIDVFPATGRNVEVIPAKDADGNLVPDSYDKYGPIIRRSNLFTEFSLTNIVNQLLAKKCFTISADSNNISFNIAGYYFTVTTKDLLGLFSESAIRETSYIEATIKIDESNSFQQQLSALQTESAASNGNPSTGLDRLTTDSSGGVDPDTSVFYGCQFTLVGEPANPNVPSNWYKNDGSTYRAIIAKIVSVEGGGISIGDNSYGVEIPWQVNVAHIFALDDGEV